MSSSSNIIIPKPTPKPISEFETQYLLEQQEIGRGSHSVVMKAIHKQDKSNMVAIKVVDIKRLTKEDEEALMIEVSLLENLSHPNIVKFLGFYHKPSVNYLVVLEYMAGGELFNRIVAKEYYSEADARQVVQTLAECLKYLHDRKIVHRDLKPENILLSAALDDAKSLKLADFGFARVVDEHGRRTACGTPGYLAPEILLGQTYGVSVDVWSLGVIIYILLCGYPPFYNNNQQLLFKSIRNGQFEFNKQYWANVSEEAKDLIRKILRVDVKRRYTIGEVLAHPWISGGSVSNVELKSALSELKKFNARRKLRAGIRAALAANRLKDIISSISPLKTPRGGNNFYYYY
jgi:calcium/calmodulin-dependent protein kinase I